VLHGIVAYGNETRETSLRVPRLELLGAFAENRSLRCQGTLKDAWVMRPGCLETPHGLKRLVAQLGHFLSRDVGTLIELFLEMCKRGQVQTTRRTMSKMMASFSSMCPLSVGPAKVNAIVTFLNALISTPSAQRQPSAQQPAQPVR